MKKHADAIAGIQLCNYANCNHSSFGCESCSAPQCELQLKVLLHLVFTIISTRRRKQNAIRDCVVLQHQIQLFDFIDHFDLRHSVATATVSAIAHGPTVEDTTTHRANSSSGMKRSRIVFRVTDSAESKPRSRQVSDSSVGVPSADGRARFRLCVNSRFVRLGRRGRTRHTMMDERLDWTA